LTYLERGLAGNSRLFEQKSVDLEIDASHSPSRPKSALATAQKRTDSKKGPLFWRFGRKTGLAGGEKSILFCTFSRFSGFLRLQVVICQNLPENFPLQNKSCLKTYGRVLVLDGF
jgi:hypothetical protein